MLDRLEANDWIERVRSEADRRAVMVRITALGISLLNKIEAPLAQCHEEQLGHLSPEELKTLSRLLTKARLPHEPEGSFWKFEI